MSRMLVSVNIWMAGYKDLEVYVLKSGERCCEGLDCTIPWGIFLGVPLISGQLDVLETGTLILVEPTA